MRVKLQSFDAGIVGIIECLTEEFSSRMLSADIARANQYRLEPRPAAVADQQHVACIIDAAVASLIVSKMTPTARTIASVIAHDDFEALNSFLFPLGLT